MRGGEGQGGEARYLKGKRERQWMMVMASFLEGHREECVWGRDNGGATVARCFSRQSMVMCHKGWKGKPLTAQNK